MQHQRRTKFPESMRAMMEMMKQGGVKRGWDRIVRYLPTPSDRMGLLWTLLTIKDGVILELVLPVLPTIVWVHFWIWNSMRGNLYCTHIDEDNIIMGDTARFEEAIISELLMVRETSWIVCDGGLLALQCHLQQIPSRIMPCGRENDDVC